MVIIEKLNSQGMNKVIDKVKRRVLFKVSKSTYRRKFNNGKNQ